MIISFSDATITVVKSGNTQLKITTTEGKIIFVDVETASRATIQNQKAGDQINSVVANFNPNGLSPVASPRAVIIPR